MDKAITLSAFRYSRGLRQPVWMSSCAARRGGCTRLCSTHLCLIVAICGPDPSAAAPAAHCNSRHGASNRPSACTRAVRLAGRVPFTVPHPAPRQARPAPAPHCRDSRAGGSAASRPAVSERDNFTLSTISEQARVDGPTQHLAPLWQRPIPSPAAAAPAAAAPAVLPRSSHFHHRPVFAGRRRRQRQHRGQGGLVAAQPRRGLRSRRPGAGGLDRTNRGAAAA